MFPLAIVGLGPAGIFTVASLPDDILSKTLLLEKSCVGGDLYSYYSEVTANIHKAWFIKTFLSIPKWADQTFPELDTYTDAEKPKLADICKILRRLAEPDIQKAHFQNTALAHLIEIEGGWSLVTTKGAMFQAKQVILCLGATPKTMDLPIRSIPLSIALSQKLAHSVSPTDKIVVFGISHSGIIVIKNLKNLGCTNVHVIYKGKDPFIVETYNGVPLSGSYIFHMIDKKEWGLLTPTFINYDDSEAIHGVLQNADAVIYAIGFEPRVFTYTNKAGDCLPVTNDTSGIYGFGIGRPRMGKTIVGEVFVDIGFEGFIKAIHAELPAILQK